MNSTLRTVGFLLLGGVCCGHCQTILVVGAWKIKRAFAIPFFCPKCHFSVVRPTP